MFASLLLATAILPKYTSHIGSHSLPNLTSRTLFGDPGIPPQFMAISPYSCAGGDTVTITITGSMYYKNQIFYISTSNNSDFSSIPSSVVLPAGSTQVSFQVTTNDVTDAPSISAYDAGGGVQQTLTITAV